MILVCCIAVGLMIAFCAPPLRAHADTERAIAVLDSLIATTPDQPELYLRRAGFHEEHANWRTAEIDVKHAAALAPDDLQVAAAFSRIYAATSRLPQARAVLDAALARREGDVELLILRARVLAKQGATAEACADYATASPRLKTPPPEFFLEWAALSREPEQALAVLDAGLTRLGPVVSLLECALEIEMRLGRTDAAVMRLDQLASLAERKEGWLKRRGDLLASAGRKTEARRAYTDALTAIEALPRWLRTAPAVANLADDLARLLKAL